MDYVIIDLQGFRDNNNKFILKEIAILNSNNETQHFIIKPPYSYHVLDLKTKKTNEWLTKHHHGLSWYFGSSNFYEVITFLKIYIKNYFKVYVKGIEKLMWIKKKLKCNNVVDINEQESKSLKNLVIQYKNYSKKCNFNHKGSCALENVYVLNLLLKNKRILY